jgi:hypothetical protein
MDESSPDATRENSIRSTKKRVHQATSSEGTEHIVGDSEGTGKYDNPEISSKEHGSCSRTLSSESASRRARNHINDKIEIPFENIDESVRERVEGRTGRSLEASYEGLTKLMDSAIEVYYDMDKSKSARRRKGRR